MSKKMFILTDSGIFYFISDDILNLIEDTQYIELEKAQYITFHVIPMVDKLGLLAPQIMNLALEVKNLKTYYSGIGELPENSPVAPILDRNNKLFS